ncbi:MAG: PAS domain S-box protein [Spirochaetota bacterium]
MKPLYTDTEDPGILTAKGVSIYAAVSTVYIIASDLLLDSLTITATAQLYIGVAKGIVFVLLTGTLLGYVLYRVNTVIRKNELTFRTVADNLKDVIYVFDSKKKKLHYINKAVETVLGYDTSLYYRDPEAIFSIIHPQDKDALYRIWSEIDMPDGLSEMTWIKRSGEEVRIEYQASLVSGGNAHGRTIVGIARDITERHRHIEQIARAERSQEALLKQLKSLHTIDKLITAYTPLETVYSVILHQALYTLDVDAAAILRSREPAHRLEAAAIDGFLASTKTEMNLAFDEGCVG